MAGKATSCYLTVCAKGSHQSVFKKTFFNIKDFNQYIKSAEFKEKYPDSAFTVIKEIY
mgnify:CR=1 FL=1|tara:strand:+ start:1295 stop:1468 length:174 start_codon:yes stop_codon:yes gene_type:complete